MVYHIKKSTGMIDDIKFIASPNCNERPVLDDINLLVIHNISLPPGQFGGAEVQELFTNQLDFNAHPYFAGLRDLRVSSHIFIRRTGEVIQFVPFSKRAWHAGESCFQGRSQCNDFSIGIELEGTDDLPYTQAQYINLIQLTKTLLATYPTITAERIVGHCDIAPIRKTDPGPAFDWAFFKTGLLT